MTAVWIALAAVFIAILGESQAQKDENKHNGCGDGSAAANSESGTSDCHSDGGGCD